MTQQRFGLLMALVLTLAALIRSFALQERVVWFDEAVSLLTARASVADILAAARDDTHPPLYNLLLHFLPRGELAARGFSVVCGVLAVAAVCALGWRKAGPVAGCLSAGLLALSPLHVWYSQEVRMYALQTLWISLSWLLLIISLDRRRWPAWAGYTVMTALSLYTQYSSLFSLVAQNLFVLIWHRSQSRAWLSVQLSVVALFVPGLPLFLHQFLGKTFGYWLRGFSWADPLRFFALLSGAIPKNPGVYWPWAVLSLLAVAGAAAVLWRRDREMTTALLLWLVVPVMLLSLASLRGNVFLPRAIVFVAPAFALLVGLAAAGLGRRGGFVLIVMAANVLALTRYYTLENPWVRSPLRTISATIWNDSESGDVVLHSSEFSYRPLQFYIGDCVSQGVVGEANDFTALDRVIGNVHFQPHGRMTRHIWLVLWPDFRYPDQHERLRTRINSEYTFVRSVHESRELYVALYETRDGKLTPMP